MPSVLKITDTLESQREFLENFHIGWDSHAEDGESFSNVNFFLGLQDFFALKYFACPLYYHQAFSPTSKPIIECLPASLLTAKWTIESSTSPKIYMPALEQLAASLGTRQSPLEEVRLVIPTSKLWESQDWTSMIKCFSATQTSFVVEQRPEEDDSFSVNWAHESTDSSISSEEVSLYSDEG